MAKFSLREDNRGASTSRSKKPRFSSSSRHLTPSSPETKEVQCNGEEEEERSHDSDEELQDEGEDEEVDYRYEDKEEEEEEEEEEEDAEDGQNFGSASAETSSTRSRDFLKPVRNGSISVTLMDPEVLDCSICYNPLTIPVFQCENGHTVCSFCCKKIAHKCPSCSMPIGYNRCRAIEKVIESIKLPCENMTYGCNELISYGKKSEHEKICPYVPCSCPLSGCTFRGSSRQLYTHVKSKHTSSVMAFTYDKTFPLFVADSYKFVLLQEENDGVIFILYQVEEHLGNMVMLSCIETSSLKGRYFYELTARMGENSLRFQSFTQNIRYKSEIAPSVGFLLVPREYFGSYGQITLDLRIWRFGTSSVMI